MGKPIAARQTKWTEIILLCGKCARKMDGGYGPEKALTLRAALRGALRATGRRGRVGLLETKCMGVCPAKAVMAFAGSRPERLLTVPRGARAEAVLAGLVPEGSAGGETGADPLE